MRPSEFRVGWARYSQIKALARQEGMRSATLIRALKRLRRGERAVAVLWQERPIAVLWLARNAGEEIKRQGFDFNVADGTALLVDAQLASDVEGSPRRETLMPAVQTFLAAEGIALLFGIDDNAKEASLPQRCGVEPLPVLQRTEVGLLFTTWSFQRKLRAFGG